MNKNRYQKIPLSKGEMYVYDFGGAKLHAYKTNDFISDEVFIVEKNGAAVMIESPCFFDNHQELENYLTENGLTVAGMLLAYHMAGSAFLPGVKKYATRNAEAYGHKGGGAALITSFTQAFGNCFDGGIHTVTDYLEAGKTEIGGISFIVRPTADAFDLEIPALNAVYTHMLGHDCHSIVAGADHADAMLTQLRGYLDAGLELVLTSHYTPEDLKDVKTKIAYLNELKALAGRCENAAGFKTLVKEHFPQYSGENYLDMTAGFFFPA